VEAAAVRAEQVRVCYGTTVAVDGVDLSVGPGEVFGIIGPNGAGKTSLIECLEGLRRPTSGRIRVDGLEPWADRTRLATVAGVQLQHTSYPTRVRVGELCRLFASCYPDPADYRDLLDRFDLLGLSRSQVTKLSGGQQQRLSLVLALIGRPRIVFLDELTTGLDPVARRNVWGQLSARRAEGLTIILTSHYMDEVEYLCDRVAVLVGGRFVAQESPSGLIRRYAGPGGRHTAGGVATASLEDVYLSLIGHNDVRSGNVR